MAAGDIHRKTERGAAEIGQRKLKLLPRLRTMLILIDGVRPEFLVKEEAAKVGAPPDFLEQLQALGLIEKISGAAPLGAQPMPFADEFSQFRAAKEFMNVTVVDALGLKSFFFTMKLERAGTRADLRELAPAYRQALDKALGEAQADVLAQRLEMMLR
ncbi:MAG: hypothetical protein ABI789_07785 [Usitatibacter sp.]